MEWITGLSVSRGDAGATGCGLQIQHGAVDSPCCGRQRTTGAAYRLSGVVHYPLIPAATFFSQRALQDAAERSLLEIAAESRGLGIVAGVGSADGVASALRTVPRCFMKGNPPDVLEAASPEPWGNFEENSSPQRMKTARFLLGGREIPLGQSFLFACEEQRDFGLCRRNLARICGCRTAHLPGMRLPVGR